MFGWRAPLLLARQTHGDRQGTWVCMFRCSAFDPDTQLTVHGSLLGQVRQRAERTSGSAQPGGFIPALPSQDDIIDDVESFVAAAEILKERGAYKIYVMATHGILSADAPRLIEESSIDEVVVTNTVPHEIQKLQCPKIKTVDISLILSEAIRRIHNGESMAYLFRNITVDD
ncbi:Phosphoribosyl pyrophosphate synthase-associated protein 1 [Tupaia chinensis]|uniref:Phosphoribosyl pyrophosphate synthase-associated protein 1 n=1 Tax=Tupaia chinensis TaxID=246437 RepID=L9L0K4_TUPCH|nr:Phosphoribosyl pyrophosphate synthase-associated protein 1 [Tupaia chinensis]